MGARSRVLWRVSPVVVRAVGRAVFALEVERQAPLPDPPFVIAANHYSHFDCPVISTAIAHPIRYLALEDLFGSSRVLDWLVEGYGAIPTPRARRPVRAVRTALGALAGGEIVGVFPEATRVSHWGTLGPKRGAAWLAIRANVPLVPVAVIGTGQVFGLDNRLHRSSIRVVTGSPIPVDSGDSHLATRKWADWLGRQVARFPNSEVDGPPRSFHDGGNKR